MAASLVRSAVRSFGRLKSGEEVLHYTLRNKNKLEVQVISYGAVGFWAAAVWLAGGVAQWRCGGFCAQAAGVEAGLWAERHRGGQWVPTNEPAAGGGAAGARAAPSDCCGEVAAP